MILSPATVLYAPLCVLGSIVGAALLVMCGVSASRRSGGAAASGDAAEAGEAAVILLGQVAFVIRLASWPALYGVLAAHVPVIPGAMCLFGVLQSAPRLLTAMEILEGTGLVVAAMAALALGLYRAGRTAVGPEVLRAHLAVLGVISVMLGAMGLAFLLMDKGVREVSCCQGMSLRDAAQTVRDFRLIEVLGRDLRVALTQAAALASMAMIAWTALRPRPLPLILSPLLAIFHLLMALATVQADLAPALTGRPEHHCLYCIPVPGSISGAGLMAVSVVVPILNSWYRFLLREDEPAAPSRILWAAFLAVPTFWGLVLFSR